MRVASESSPQKSRKAGAGLVVCDGPRVHWRRLLIIGATGLLLQAPLQAPLQAKPIAGCLVQDADLVDPTSCLSPPERLASTRPASQTTLATQPDRVARVTLETLDSGSVSRSGSRSEQSSVVDCSALRGTHEAQSIMLQNIQKQLINVERNRRSAKNTLRSLRRSGADQVQLNSAAGRVTTLNAVWSVLKGDVKTRTKSFNKSMTRLTKACLRG